MKRTLKLLLFLLTVMLVIPVQAQNNPEAYVLLSGHVKNKENREGVADAEIHVPGTNVGVITNEDGYFSLKVNEMPKELDVAAIGFRNHLFNLNSVKNKEKLEFSPRNFRIPCKLFKID